MCIVKVILIFNRKQDGKWRLLLILLNFIFSSLCLKMTETQRKIILYHDFFSVCLDSNTHDDSIMESNRNWILGKKILYFYCGELNRFWAVQLQIFGFKNPQNICFWMILLIFFLVVIIKEDLSKQLFFNLNLFN